MNKKTIAGIGLVTLGAFVFGMGKREQVKRDSNQQPTPHEFSLDTREKVLFYAKGEIGPQDPSKYWTEVLPNSTGFKGAWCGGFSLWVLHQAGLAKNINWEIGKGYCYRLPITNDPKPGDIAYIDQPYQHHAIVESVNNGMVATIDGNQPGNTVARRVRPMNAITAFYSIDPLIDSGNLAV